MAKTQGNGTQGTKTDKGTYHQVKYTLKIKIKKNVPLKIAGFLTLFLVLYYLQHPV